MWLGGLCSSVTITGEALSADLCGQLSLILCRSVSIEMQAIEISREIAGMAAAGSLAVASHGRRRNEAWLGIEM